jgi:hypothetical protein
VLLSFLLSFDKQHPTIGKINPTTLSTVSTTRGYGFYTTCVQGCYNVVDAVVNTLNLTINRHTNLILKGLDASGAITLITY